MPRRSISCSSQQWPDTSNAAYLQPPVHTNSKQTRLRTCSAKLGVWTSTPLVWTETATRVCLEPVGGGKLGYSGNPSWPATAGLSPNCHRIRRVPPLLRHPKLQRPPRWCQSHCRGRKHWKPFLYPSYKIQVTIWGEARAVT